MTQAHANSHTHCQVAQANAQTKTWQRVCLFQSTKDSETHDRQEGQQLTAVWRNGELCASYDSFVVGSSAAVLRLNFCAKNPPLPQVAKRQIV
jgi:hypothetical protein